MSPVKIEILFRFYTRPDAMEKMGEVCRSPDGFISELANVGLLGTDDAGKYQLSDRGKAYIDMLLAVPLPVRKWVDPRMEKQDGN